MNTRQFYDRYNFTSPSRYGLGRYNFFKDIVPKGSKALDVGCGTGRTSRLIHNISPGLKIFAIDISAKSLEKCPTYINKKVGDALDIPYNNNTFDFVYSIGCLHHTPDARKGFSECCRVLKPGCGLAVSLFSKWNIYNILYKLTSRFPGFIKNMVRSPFLQDMLFSPRASFHSFREVKGWFEQNNIKLVKHKSAGFSIYYYGMQGI